MVTQGEPGAPQFVIVSSPERVLGDGVDVALLGPGERFGAIALLRPGPRRATAQAEGPMELLALEREPFLLRMSPGGSTHRRDALDIRQ